MKKNKLMTLVVSAAVIIQLGGCTGGGGPTHLAVDHHITLQPGEAIPVVSPPDTLSFFLPSGTDYFWVHFQGRNPCRETQPIRGHAPGAATCNVVRNPAGDTDYIYTYGKALLPPDLPDNIIICRGCR